MTFTINDLAVENSSTVGGVAVVVTTDSRLSDARTPVAHAVTHQPGGTDAISTASAISIASSNTEGTATSLARSDHTHQGIHALKVETGGTNRFGDLVLKGTSANISITDDASGNFTWDLVGTAVTPGSYGSASQVGTFTVDAKGRLTAAASTSIQIAESQVTNLVSDLAGKQPLDGDLTAVAGLSTTGLIARTAANAMTTRTITGTAANISVTDGDGVAANPTINLIDTAVGAGSYGSTSQVATFTVDAKGRLTAAANASISITSAAVSDFTEAAQDAVGGILTDTASIDFTYNDAGNAISAVVLPAGVDHNSLANLATGDVHTQYALLAGRSGGQTLIGGTVANNNLTLRSTSNATKGFVLLADQGGNVGVGLTSPASLLHIDGTTGLATALKFTNGTTTGQTATDGFDVGISTTGVAEIRQRENLAMQIFTNNTRVATLSAAGQFVVGPNDPQLTSSTDTSRFQVQGTDAATSQAALMRYSADAASATFRFTKSRNAAIGSHTTVTLDDFLGSMSYRGSDGTNFITGATINAQVDGTVATNGMPTRLVFNTTATGASSSTERMRLTAAGEMMLSTSLRAAAVNSISVASSPYSVTASDLILFVDTSAARTLNLPDPALRRVIYIVDVIGTAETNNITLARFGSEKIAGLAASKLLQTNWGSWVIASNGTDYFLL